MKRLILVLVCLCMLATTAFAGYTEMHEAWGNEDWTTALSEAEKVIADPDATTIQKVVAQYYKGVCYTRQEQHIKAIEEFQKMSSNYPQHRYYSALSYLRIGFCYGSLQDTDLERESFLKVLTDYPDATSIVLQILETKNWVLNLLTDEEVARMAFNVWRANQPPTAKNSDLLSKILGLITQFVPGITKDNLTITEVREAITAKWGEVK